MSNDITRNDEEKFLKYKIAENQFLNKNTSFNTFIEYILNGDVKLEADEDDGTKVVNFDNLEEIEKTIPSLLAISNSPRSFIKTLEEKVPVETAKRINHKAIMRLSQDSNDWHARTMLTVKPKNVVSDVNDETLDLYENRFVVSLIDKISRLLTQAKVYYKEQERIADEREAAYAMSKEYFYTTSSFSFFNKISKNRSNYVENGFREKIRQVISLIEKIEKKLAIIRRSNFYNALRNKRRVADPIQKTNILMFDFHYNKAYKLWKELNTLIDLPTIEEIDASDSEKYYNLYSFSMILAAFNDMGFVEKTGNCFRFEEGLIVLDNELVFEKKNINISLTIKNNKFILSYKYYIGKRVFDDIFSISSNYLNFEGLTRREMSDKSEEILNSLVKVKNKKDHLIPSYCFVSLNMTRCSNKTSISEKICRRFYSIGNNFSDEEENSNLSLWGNYNAGLLIVTPMNLRSNFLRIEKLINSRIMIHSDLDNIKNVCPICGNKKMTMIDSNNFICYDCHHRISINYCNSCDPQHKHKILWIKYSDDKFLTKEEVVSGDFANQPPHYRCSKLETVMGELATTSFVLEKENTGWKLKTICPRCGIKLGDKA